MRKQNQTNALLVELLIVIAFFMLGATILIRVFGASHRLAGQAERMAEAMLEAQNTADTLYSAADVGQALEELGFTQAPEGEGLPGQSGGENIAQTEGALPDGEALPGQSGAQAEEAAPAGETQVWVRQDEDYELRVSCVREVLEHGVMNRMQVQAADDTAVLITLPCSRYDAAADMGE